MSFAFSRDLEDDVSLLFAVASVMLGCDVLVDHHFNDAVVSRQETDVANCLDDVATVGWKPSGFARPSILEFKSEATPVPPSCSLRS